MSILKEKLNINSFSKVVGYSQPPITCPMIDDELHKHNADLSSIEYEISLLNESISAINEGELPSEREIEKMELKVSSLESKKHEILGLIENLEKDRKTISELRAIGFNLRDHWLGC